MNPYYAAPPPPPQQQQQAAKVDLDDLFGGPSSPAVSANANHGSVRSDFAPAPPPIPPPPSYDAVGSNGYGAYPAVSHTTYATPPPLPQPHPQQQVPQQQPGYGSAPPAIPMQGYATTAAQVPQPSYMGYSAPPAAHVALPSQQPQPQSQPQPIISGSPHAAPTPAPAVPVEEDERAQLERIVRLRRELEQEQEREQRKKDELQTWGCTVCTFRNKLGVVKCEMCGSVRPGYAAPATTPSSSSAAAAAPSAQSSVAAAAPPPVRAGVTAWQCGMCLAPNDASAERCKVCYAYRSSGTPVPSTSVVGGGAGTGVVSQTPFTTRWKCSVCGEVNVPSNARCKICNGYQRNGTPVTEEAGHPSNQNHSSNHNGGGGDPPLPTTWACSVCTFENPTSAAVCTACDSGQRPRHLAPKRTGKAAHADSKPHGERKVTKQWPCPTCTFENPIGRKKCDMCGAKRPDKYASAADTAEARADARQEAQDDEEEVAWQDDTAVTECNNCHTSFTFFNRRHHCRLCGFVFCAHCANYAMILTENTFPQRVCVNCYKARKEQEKKLNKGRKWLEQ